MNPHIATLESIRANGFDFGFENEEYAALDAAIALMRGQSEAEYVITLLVESRHVDQATVDQARRIIKSVKPTDPADEQ